MEPPPGYSEQPPQAANPYSPQQYAPSPQNQQPYSPPHNQQPYPPPQNQQPYPPQQFSVPPPPPNIQYNAPSHPPPQGGAYPPQVQNKSPYDGKVPPPYSEPQGYMSAQQPSYMPGPQAISQNTTNTTTVIMTAPTPVYNPPNLAVGEVPPSYMWLSWLVCLFCCWPLGLAAIIASSRVDAAISAGNFIEARAQSSRAKSYAIAGVFCGIIIIAILIIRFTVLASTTTSYQYN